jgi:RNA polymerase sigma-70 factor (ECF subfamily)
MTDIELIKDILAGHKEAYAELVRQYQGRVISLCASLLPQSSQAEDAAQEAFLKAYKALGSFKGTSSFSTWLYRIAVNHCKDIQRKSNRERSVSLDLLLEQEGEKIHKLFRDPSDAVKNIEDTELTGRILSALSPQYKEALVLREVQGLSYEEIAAVLKCSVESVRAKLRRARIELLKLRHFLDS